MSFSRKRGRPKTIREKKDYGTPQLREKQNMGLTSEPLDLCLSKKLISPDEHAAGIRLRWLYTLRFGSPNISAYRHELLSVNHMRNDDEDWLNARKLEYENYIKELTKLGAKRIVMNICIFSQRSSFLFPYHDGIPLTELKERRAQFTVFKDGMESLVKNQ